MAGMGMRMPDTQFKPQELYAAKHLAKRDIYTEPESGPGYKAYKWVIAAIVLIAELYIFWTAINNITNDYAVQADYEIIACEVEETEDSYLLQVSLKNYSEYARGVIVESNVKIEYVSSLWDMRSASGALGYAEIPGKATTTVMYRVDKEDIGDEGLRLQLNEVYEPQEWVVELS